MSYPNAFCVKCGTHTDTQKKHTVMLQNNARALKGVCPSCSSDVYKILPKGKAYLTKVPLNADERRRYPNAFCVKCQEHTPTVDAHTVMFESMRRAVTGSCGACGSEVYRILGIKDATETPAAETVRAAQVPVPARAAAVKHVMPRSALGAAVRSGGPVGERRVTLTRSAELAGSARWSYVAATGVIVAIVAAFYVYALV